MTPKVHEPRLARVAAVVADPARSRMLCLLLSGESATAGELAKAASVAPSTAMNSVSAPVMATVPAASASCGWR